MSASKTPTHEDARYSPQIVRICPSASPAVQSNMGTATAQPHTFAMSIPKKHAHPLKNFGRPSESEIAMSRRVLRSKRNVTSVTSTMTSAKNGAKNHRSTFKFCSNFSAVSMNSWSSTTSVSPWRSSSAFGSGFAKPAPRMASLKSLSFIGSRSAQRNEL